MLVAYLNHQTRLPREISVWLAALLSYLIDTQATAQTTADQLK